MSHPVFEGHIDATGLRFAVLVSRFNSFITDRLLAGALDALTRHGIAESDVELIQVPGSWEMPVAAQAIVKLARHDALICLGAVVRGETPHFDYVAGEVAKGLAHV